MVFEEHMNLDGPSFYDDATVFETYMKRRERDDSPNDTLEEPVIQDLLGDPAGHDVLDLGCGDGRFGLSLLERGATSYTGVDGSENMIRQARTNLIDGRAKLIRSDLESLSLPDGTFSLAVARLVLHYLKDLQPLLKLINSALKPGSLFLFSVEHPVITSSSVAVSNSGKRQNWIVDDYFRDGRRVTRWMGGNVVKYHRTIEDYFALVGDSGFCVESLRESRPQRENFNDEELFVRRRRIPLFLIVAARKLPREGI